MPPDSKPEHLLSWVYDGFEKVEPAQWHDYYAHRACVAPTNEACDALNRTMLEQLDPSSERVSYSRDLASSESPLDTEYSVEFLHGLTTGGLPPHELRLRRGALLIVLRNYAPHKGLCNGTRVVVDCVRDRLLVVRIVTGPLSGQVEVLPRICCDSAGDLELPFVLRRYQYPVKPAWCMTINKSQGQTIGQRLCIYLPTPVFCHGQLYVAFSRARNYQGVKVFLENSDYKQYVAVDTKHNVARQYTTNIVDRDFITHSAPALKSDICSLQPGEQSAEQLKYNEDVNRTTAAHVSTPSTTHVQDDRADLVTVEMCDSGVDDVRPTANECAEAEQKAREMYEQNPFAFDEWSGHHGPSGLYHAPAQMPSRFLSELTVADLEDPDTAADVEASGFQAECSARAAMGYFLGL